MTIPAGSFPVLPLKNTVLYPGVTQALRVGRDKSVRAVDLAQQKNNWILTLAQKNPEHTVENVDDLHDIGTLCKIESIKSANESGYFIVVRGYYRVRVSSFRAEAEIFEAYVERLDDMVDMDRVTESALLSTLKTVSKEVLELVPGNTESVQEIVDVIDDISLLTYMAAANAEITMIEKQNLLEIISVKSRVMHLLSLLHDLKERMKVHIDIRNKLTSKIGQTQRDHILREQLKTIKEELGEKDEFNFVEGYRQKIADSGLSKEAHELALQQLNKLENSNSQSPEYQMVRSHLDFLLALPWNRASENKEIDLILAEKILNQDHFGLDKIKKRILQHLAVMKLKNDKKGSILLFIGPPGVGKTSLGQSIARALGKKYQRISLGGVRDESEIRGHRRTYIGALPGRILSALKKADQNDAVFVLDEIDKLSRSYSGDPSAALLEVLDPEQNNSFSDHYLDTPFDLSNITFIATANSLENIPLPLLDRMEVIDLSGYTTAEKLHIAKNHLWEKQLLEHGLEKENVQITDTAVMKIISHYTREAGVRDLQRKLQEVCRAVCERVLKHESKIIIDIADVETIFGSEKYSYEVTDQLTTPGVVTGLAWTPVGGDILFIESAAVPGKGDLILTGQLGDVMKESAQIAKSLIKARMSVLNPTFDFNKFDLHIHLPAGAIPKDGPSAGITLLTSLASLVSRTPVNPRLAMTGEISLRGRVMPVGGVKEKVIAAHRSGVNKIIMSKKNEKDLKDIPDDVRSQIEFIFAEHINDVISYALNIDLSQWNEDLIHGQNDRSLHHRETLHGHT
ncbi:MAG: endopeptidase La [Bdellovibrionales bacterium RIFCSPHIGHO2_01_FULL_40_29]|nr:MAG: endopeptidase La [Bdellovibrionales bacterium RIFCSPHIGHO2_01_FULL_40_29]OFZ35348.1 MAG: endopeptidase La [Bdellovibrionales bacterium RIFCSPHIGHO2_02_FULL_40_15]